MWLWLEIAGAIVGLVYLYLEFKANIWLWLVSIIMPAIYIFVYYHGGFYADVGINVWYLGAGIYGWIMWRRGGLKDDKLLISHTPKSYFIPLLAVTLLIFAAIAFVLLNYTDSTVPYGDSITTAMSITALWMLSRKYVEQWLVWIVVDAICAGLYLYKGLYPTSALYAVYTVAAVFGYLNWKKMMAARNNARSDKSK